MQANETVTTGNETVALHTGDLKFSVSVSNWAFCAPCDPGNIQGSYLALVVDVQSSASVLGADASDGHEHKAMQIGLGAGASLSLSSVVQVDSSYTTTDVAVTTSGNIATFTVKLPKFAHKVVYDPVLSIA